MEKSEAEAEMVLIVEDNKSTADMLAAQLREAGYRVTIAFDVKQARKVVDEQLPSLILLDIVLPEVSGLDYLVELRRDFPAIELPIVVVTVKDENHDIISGLENGANDYVTKPFHKDIVRTRVQSQLKMRHLYREQIRAREIATVAAMVATYNHQINNPLAVAMGGLARARKSPEAQYFDRVDKSLSKIRDIVKKISNLTDSVEIENENYVLGAKLIKLD